VEWLSVDIILAEAIEIRAEILWSEVLIQNNSIWIRTEFSHEKKKSIIVPV
jgi:hypothetical protein